jgi:2-alkenal reductase
MKGFSMDWNKLKFLLAGLGCAAFFGILLVGGLLLLPLGLLPVFQQSAPPTQAFSQVQASNITPITTTVTPLPQGTPLAPGEQNVITLGNSERLENLYQKTSPGVVSIYVNVNQGGANQTGTGSGFILDSDGHIITNNHVVSEADLVVVVFHDGTQAEAQIIGTDDDSDLAVIKVDQLPEDTYPLPLGDSNQINPGDWVIAIGNPFGLSSSMSIGIVSAIGRTIPSGATPFAIPEAIQTDAAINPGNSGGPLLDLNGTVIGVNAQIASSGVQANAGVGFAIPVNVVQRVAPILIEVGDFQWPWLGISGTSLDLLITEANELESQKGAYILSVVPDSPADKAGLSGQSGTRMVSGFELPTGGDVVKAINGIEISNYSDLQALISSEDPSATVTLTVLRDGEMLEIPVQLAPRPESFNR